MSSKVSSHFQSWYVWINHSEGKAQIEQCCKNCFQNNRQRPPQSLIIVLAAHVRKEPFSSLMIRPILPMTYLIPFSCRFRSVNTFYSYLYIVCDSSYLCMCNSIFYHNCLVHVSVLSSEHTCTTNQHYHAFQYVLL